MADIGATSVVRLMGTERFLTRLIGDRSRVSRDRSLCSLARARAGPGGAERCASMPRPECDLREAVCGGPLRLLANGGGPSVITFWLGMP